MANAALNAARRSARAKLMRCPTYVDGSKDNRREISDELHAELVAAKLCPNCASYVSAGVPELERQRADPEHHACDQCPDCEEAYNVDTSDSQDHGPEEGHSDADPGL